MSGNDHPQQQQQTQTTAQQSNEQPQAGEQLILPLYTRQFNAAVQMILIDEGPMSDDALGTDPDGGLTKYGWSQTQNPDIDVANLTRAQAIQLYYTRMWLYNSCDKMSWPVNLMLFDSSVNQGPECAARLLQASVGVIEDGDIGPITLAAVNNQASQVLTARFTAKRAVNYTTDLEWSMDGEGWMYRLAHNCLAANLQQFGAS